KIARDGNEDRDACEKWKAGLSPTSPDPGSHVLTEKALPSVLESYPDAYLNPELDAEVMSYFAPEAQEYLEAMEASVLRLEKEPDKTDIIQELFRTAHTLKGSAHTVGFKSIGDLVHYVEDYMGEIREGRMTVTPELTDLIFRAIDVVKLLMRRDSGLLVKARAEFSSVVHRLIQFNQADAGLPSAEPLPAEAGAVPAVVEANATPVGPRSADGERRTEGERRKEADGKPQEENSVIRVSRDRLERLLNLVGELVISRGRLEQRLVALEQLSDQVLMFKGRMLDAVRTFEEKHAFTLPAASPQAIPNLSEFQGLTDFGGLEFDRYDDFNILARRMGEVSADVGESMSQLSGSIRKAREDMSQLQRLTLGMRDEIARARMVPVGTPFTRFRRAVREMARATSKNVNLVISGEHTEVDTGVVERLVDPLIHLVRNAVYHGIEPMAIRVARGKPDMGTVYLHAAHRGNSVVIEVEDDGGGIDVAKVKAKAVALGFLRAESVNTMSDSEAIKFIFLPGFSTADEVGDQAGRGVGMDVVKRALEGMNGQIDVETELGAGTKFTLRLPLTLLISMALLVRVGSERYALPLQSIREVVLPAQGDIQDVGGQAILQVGHEAIEVKSLGRLLGHDSMPIEGPSPVIIVRTTTGVQGFQVDELLGRQEIVIKTLGTLRPFLESSFVGATIDPEGHVILVLDVGRLLTGHQQDAPALPEHIASGPQKPEEETDGSGLWESQETGSRLLLIDDSLSIRKFVGRMLEGAGYTVETAVDGEEGLRKASAGSYSLIITDLEMPKLNGYEVIQALRDRPQTKSTPILVMTTRAGEKHRQMALSIGATGYIAKPVEERALILEIAQWIGPAHPAKR
ncbi:MAG TPA: hybrid sensor histidine kinase/response regulator, partial [Nitrospiraceae bacterium]|nr:hybrid sensor histidine kinase/response regulator [Nitrospiraceae bacterium]